MALINNEAFEILKSAFEQATGREDLEITDLQHIVDLGNDPTILQEKAMFGNALFARLYDIMWVGNNESYRGKLEDVFYTNKEEFGAILEVADVVPPEVIANPAFTTLVDGVTVLHDTPIYLPKIYAQVFGQSTSWALNVAYSDKQLAAAFTSASEMASFYNFAQLQVRNSIAKHKETMIKLSLLNFIAEKYQYAQGEAAEGTHVVDLVAEYAKYADLDSMTVEEFRQSAKAKLYAQQIINFYWDLMSEWNTQLNTAGRDRFTPEGRRLFLVNSLFDSDMKTIALSDSSWDKAFMEGTQRMTLASWQGTKGLDFDVCTHVNVKSASGTNTEIGNVVGVMLDKWAIMHTIVDEYVGTDRDGIKRVTATSFQFTDRMLNNLTLNGVVFVLGDYTKASQQDEG